MRNRFSGFAVVSILGSALLGGCDDSGAPAAPPTYAIGGSVQGLTGSIVLVNNGNDVVTLAADGTFAFNKKLSAGAGYAIEIDEQPEGQLCAVSNAHGTVGGAAVSNVLATCVTQTPYSISGTVSGLRGTLVLALNDAETKTITADGPFAFTHVVPGFSPYSLVALRSPPGQDCAVADADGTSDEVNQVAVTCQTGSAGAWGIASRVETTMNTATAPEIAVGSNGHAVVVWQGSDPERLFANRYVPGSGWQQPTRIATVGAVGISVAVNASGEAVVAWQAYDEASSSAHTFASRLVAGNWSSAETVSDSDADRGYSQTRVDINDAGHAVVAWVENSLTGNNVRTTRYVPGNGWQATTPLAVGGSPQVVMDTHNIATVLWTEMGTGTSSIRYARNVDGIWQSASSVANGTASDNLDYPRIAVDASDRIVAVWNQHDGSDWRVYASRFDPAGGWSAATDIDTGAGSALYPVVAVNSTGTAFVVWDRYDNVCNCGSLVEANRFIPGSGWQTAGAVTSARHPQVFPTVGVDASGRGLAVWLQSRSDGNLGYDIRSSEYRAGAWQLPVPVETRDDFATWLGFGMADDGSAFASFTQDIGGTGQVFANRWRPR